ncbi:MAG: acyl carrier protein [Planctomycetes bacterium]|nr:acyl carrier protein [Planctomycetota bacterium]
MDAADPERMKWVTDVLTGPFEVPVASITPDARLREDLGLESLDLVDMVLEIERRVGRRLENEDVSSIRTVADVIALVQKLEATPA